MAGAPGQGQYNAAIQRIIKKHYGGNVNDPRAQRFLARMSQNPNSANPVTQRVISMLALGG